MRLIDLLVEGRKKYFSRKIFNAMVGFEAYGKQLS